MKLSHITFAYPGHTPLFDNFSLDIEERSHVALLGPSGVGKSTLARLMKGILSPGSGVITCDGMPTEAHHDADALMTRVGLVFQNPDNTMVATTVETELAFGLENMGVPYEVMTGRITDVLAQFNLTEYRHASPSHLSGGEKQRLALAAVMIMRPAMLVLDEPTALLDQPSRRRVMDMLASLADSGTTILHITPFAEEASAAERVIVLDENGCAADGAPGEVMPYLSGFRSCAFPHRPSSTETAIPAFVTAAPSGFLADTVNTSAPVLRFDHAGFVYEPGTPFAHRALTEVHVAVPSGQATVVLGHSGSGKSTLLELAAGLAKPTEGTVIIAPELVRAMAFQLPEDQMFGADVGEYVAFGLRNLGYTGPSAEVMAADALMAVGIEPERCRGRDPLTLSGGEQRLVALAGVLAMQPGLLVLDEPTAGLDRAGMLRVIGALDEYVRGGGTLLFSTHDGEVAHALATHAMVLVDGRVETVGGYEEVLAQSIWLRDLAAGA